MIDENAMYDRGYRYEDLVRAVDVVVTKPGYGIISECIANDTALLYTSRGDFREYQVLVDAMPKYLRCAFIDHADLFAGHWQPHLDACSRSRPPTRPATNGADVAADILLAHFNDRADRNAGTRLGAGEPFPSPKTRSSPTAIAFASPISASRANRISMQRRGSERRRWAPGHVHGGAMAATLDEAMGAVCWMNGHQVVAATITIISRDAADRDRNDRRSHDRARRRTQDALAVAIKDPSGRIVAEGSGLFIVLKEDALRALSNL